jgi:hypothetical protein
MRRSNTRHSPSILIRTQSDPKFAFLNLSDLLLYRNGGSGWCGFERHHIRNRCRPSHGIYNHNQGLLEPVW